MDSAPAVDLRKSTRIKYPTAKCQASRSVSMSRATSSVSRGRSGAATSKYFEDALTIDNEHSKDRWTHDAPLSDTTVMPATAEKRKRSSALAVSRTITKINDSEVSDTEPSRLKKTKKLKTEVQDTRKGLSAKYAPPEKYAHLQYLTDYLSEGLDVVFCGINPGRRSAEVGHHFAHPSNHFWKCLHQSGFTERQLHPSEDVTLPAAYNLGMTDLVERPSSEQAELSQADMLAGVPTLLAKVVKYKPRVICFVGKQIGEVFCKEATRLAQIDIESNPGGAGPSTERNDIRRGITRNKTAYKWGIQDFKVSHAGSCIAETLFFIMPSTSARVAGYQLADKVKIMKDLYESVQRLKAMDMNGVKGPKVEEKLASIPEADGGGMKDELVKEELPTL